MVSPGFREQRLPAAPRLQPADIEQELKRIYRGGHTTHLVALFGTGEEGSLAVYGRTYQVVPTRCELDLRAAIPGVAQDYSPGRVFLVDWAEQLPLDLSSRLAGQRLHHISGLSRLATLFGARQVDPSLQGTAIARVLLASHGQEWYRRLGRCSSPVLRRDEALWQFLQAYLDQPPPREPSVADLLAMAVLDGQGPGLAQRMVDDATWAQLGGEIEEGLTRQGGTIARLAWQAWLRGAGEGLLEHLVLVDALREHLGKDHYAEGWLKSELSRMGGDWREGLPRVAMAVDADLLQKVIEGIDARATEGRPGQLLLQRADRRLGDPRLQQAAVGSRLLPAAHLELTRNMAELLGRASDERPLSKRTLAELVRVEAALARHLHDATLRERDRLRRKMAVRLAHYLAERGEAALTEGPADYREAMALADRFVREGGYVDWGRRLLRGTQAYPLLGPSYVALVRRVDALRRQDDRRFAEGLVDWVSAGSPSDQAIPIAEVSRRIVAEFLGGGEHRRLLLLLMDGMSWANAIELVTSMGHESGHWGPATWQPKGHQGRAAFLPPVIAALPSLTNVSRAALFAGKLPKSGPMPSAGDDPKRWAANRWARKLSSGEEEQPVLLLKDLATREGGVTQDAERLIAGDHRLVALVINAIDDHLSGSDQFDVMYTAEQIHPLGAILDAAMASERAVLLVSDHGHVPGVGLSSVAERPRQGGSRWRVMGPGDKPAEFEVALPEKGTWWPSGARGVAAVWDETRCYGPPKAGKHGGASLAEVVAPAMLLVPETLVTWLSDEDPELNGLSLPSPDWWCYDAPRSRLLADVKPVPTKRTKKKTPVAAGQLPLLDVAQAQATPFAASAGVLPSRELPAIVRQLKASPVFQEHVAGMPPARVKKALEALALIVEAGDRIGVEAFARLSGVPGWRVPGFVSAEISPVLNRDGYSVVEYDRQGKQVGLSRERLDQIYLRTER